MKKNWRKKGLMLFLAFVLLCAGMPRTVQAGETGMIESLGVSVSKKGFHPSKGNYLRIKAYIDTSYTDATWGYETSCSADIRLRICNSDGKYVFQKKYKNSTGGYLDYKWNGKASKNNKAGVQSGSYVEDGEYTVELTVVPSVESLSTSTRTCSFLVSSKAKSGKAGLSAAKTLPVLTGNSNVDYMAEQICKAAKVTSSLSDDEKVKRIYHWMTTHQKHAHYYEGGSFKTYYKLSSSKKKIQSYKKTCDKQYKKGKLLYNYSMRNEEWCMERRIGVCTDHAAIFKILCSHVGVESGICSGYYLNRNGTKASHSWNYAIVNGTTYYYDVDVEIQNYGKGQGDYYWYKKTRTEANVTHEFHNIE